MIEKPSLQIDYDIVIVGAGLAGCLLAYAILKLSPALKIALIDDNPEKLAKGTHPGFDARSIALSIGSCELLQALGLWTSLKEKAQPIDDINISDRGHFGALDLAKNNSDQSFGYVVELQDVGAIISTHLGTYTQLTRLYNTRPIAIEKNSEYVICQLQEGLRITAKLCVAADGAHSLTRDLLGISSQISDYGCTAVIANVGGATAHLNKAYERFTEDGPIALLPLTENRFSLVWSVNNNDIKPLASLNERDFLAALQQAFGFRAGIFKTAGKREHYPLQLVKIAKPITHRGLCIGNAAHGLHPVMGQGFNLGLRDLYVLAQVISKIEDKGEVGGYSMVNQYWCARQADHKKTMEMTDSIVRIFSNNSWLFILGRNIALQAMRCFSSLTVPIVKQAKGQFITLNGINNDSIL